MFLVLYDTIENTPKKQKTLRSFANKLVEAVFDDQRQQDHLFSVERYSYWILGTWLSIYSYKKRVLNQVNIIHINLVKPYRKSTPQRRSATKISIQKNIFRRQNNWCYRFVFNVWCCQTKNQLFKYFKTRISNENSCIKCKFILCSEPNT